MYIHSDLFLNGHATAGARQSASQRPSARAMYDNAWHGALRMCCTVDLRACVTPACVRDNSCATPKAASSFECTVLSWRETGGWQGRRGSGGRFYTNGPHQLCLPWCPWLAARLALPVLRLFTRCQAAWGMLPMTLCPWFNPLPLPHLPAAPVTVNKPMSQNVCDDSMSSD